MSHRERIRDWLRTHPVATVFLALAAVPTTLAVFSFRQPIPLPDAILSELEMLFWLLVYAPVSGLRSFLFEPFGLDVLFSIPGLEQTLIVVTLLGFYYGLSHALVRGVRLIHRQYDASR
ncbi:hypothetical protein [Natronorubrum sp. FCH18a]|uniref:hypothetical protein n=1 Tax=Natronorubrum sp. FCH18a TaxID=3447018 RepID=UPI003F517F4D